MESALGDNHIVHLGCRQHLEELIVVSLDDTALLQLQLVALLNGLTTGSLISRFVTTQILHLVPYGTLLMLHLPVDGEELRSLIGCERCLLGDKCLHVGLELLG